MDQVINIDYRDDINIIFQKISGLLESYRWDINFRNYKIQCFEDLKELIDSINQFLSWHNLKIIYKSDKVQKIQITKIKKIMNDNDWDNLQRRGYHSERNIQETSKGNLTFHHSLKGL